MKEYEKILGILGGMGPASTVLFLNKIVDNTDAAEDQDHLPIILYSNPQVPDRTNAYKGRGVSPIEALVKGIDTLVGAGADIIAIPCNSAHLWMSEMRIRTGADIIDMIQLTVDKFKEKDRVGILGTTLTIESKLYENLLIRKGVEVLLPSDQDFIMKQIRMIKASNISLARENLKTQAEILVDKGATHILAGCTEVPLALSQEDLGVPYIDPLDMLAVASIKAVGGTLKSPSPS